MSPDTDGARALVDRFIDAFNRLDGEGFRACLAADVSLFAPGSAAGLIEGAAVLAHFDRVFREEAPEGPRIRPRSLRCQALGADAALVSFEFERDGGSLGRRTLALRRERGEWRVAHIHASNT